MNLGLDSSTIALILGGALGAFIHALLNKDYSWQSKFALVDILEGAALGILIPLIPLPWLLKLANIDFQLPVQATALTPIQKFAAMTFMAWPLVTVLRERVLSRFQPMSQDRRATDPKPPQAPQEAPK